MYDLNPFFVKKL